MTSCGEGWIQYGYHCYYLNMSSAAWDDAMQTCHGLGAYLVAINSAEENEWIRLKRESEFWPINQIWTGGTDRNDEGSFIWENSKKALNYSNWGPGEPNDDSTSEDCLTLYFSGGNWNDEKCHLERPFVCEKTFF
ncbi:perlucin-like protein [Saccostrea cucullata]|uniref:perlucin-like protein n=1 Tax=Saccostrea cuccullata TaxID=36930 RepID=UPI002ED13F5C